MGERALAVNGVVGGDLSLRLGGIGIGEEGLSRGTAESLANRRGLLGLSASDARPRFSGGGRGCPVVPDRLRTSGVGEGRAALVRARFL